MTQPTHTPAPHSGKKCWKHVQSLDGKTTEIIDVGNNWNDPIECVLKDGAIKTEKAEMLCKIVNCHDELLEALEDLVHAAFEHGNKSLSGKTLDPDGELLGYAKLAIAKARG